MDTEEKAHAYKVVMWTLLITFALGFVIGGAFGYAVGLAN